MNMQIRSLTKKTGFSLIELMVVIAIVALLAAIAIPSYKSYVSRSKAAEVNGLISHYLTVWSDNNNANKTADDTFTPGNYIASIEVVNSPSGTNHVVVTMNATTGIDTSLDGAVLTFTPSTDANNITDFACSGGSATIATFIPSCT